MCVCVCGVCVCVCVYVRACECLCVRERERERECMLAGLCVFRVKSAQASVSENQWPLPPELYPPSLDLYVLFPHGVLNQPTPPL